MKIAKGIAAITYRGISFLGIGFGIGIISLGLTLPGIGHAQVTNATGTIQGTITDPSGAVVPNAQVTIAEPSTGSKKVVQTTGDRKSVV